MRSQTFAPALLALTLLTPYCALAASFSHQHATAPSTLKSDFQHITLINMSGQSRQACVGNQRIDLPVAQGVVLQVHLGDTVRVVSNMDQHLTQRIVVTEADIARTVPIT